MNSFIDINIEILKNAKNLPLPSYQTDGASGIDLFAAVIKPIEMYPMERVLIPTGLKISLPPNMEAQIRSRSGIAYNYGVTVLNSPGTIDSDYRGEIKIVLINLSQNNFMVERGSRIAQMVISPITKARLNVVSTLNETKRGLKGFGSTG